MEQSLHVPANATMRSLWYILRTLCALARQYRQILATGGTLPTPAHLRPAQPTRPVRCQVTTSWTLFRGSPRLRHGAIQVTMLELLRICVWRSLAKQPQDSTTTAANTVGFVITRGTDTMEEKALLPNKPHGLTQSHRRFGWRHAPVHRVFFLLTVPCDLPTRNYF